VTLAIDSDRKVKEYLMGNGSSGTEPRNVKRFKNGHESKRGSNGTDGWKPTRERGRIRHRRLWM